MSSAEERRGLLNVNRCLDKHGRSLVSNGLGVNHRGRGRDRLQSAQEQHICVCHAHHSEDHPTDCCQQCFHTAPFEFDAVGFENLHLHCNRSIWSQGARIFDVAQTFLSTSAYTSEHTAPVWLRLCRAKIFAVKNSVFVP